MKKHGGCQPGRALRYAKWLRARPPTPPGGALPAAALVFLRWTPETKMIRGDWNIPVPPPEADALTPDITLATCLGWSEGCYRLGWGGGYFDRTLAALAPRPMAIGIALSAGHLRTNYPQPHDIALELIVTEAGVSAERTATP